MIIILAFMILTSLATYAQEGVAKVPSVQKYFDKGSYGLCQQKKKWFMIMNSLLDSDLKRAQIVPTDKKCTYFELSINDHHEQITAKYIVNNSKKYSYTIDLYPNSKPTE